MIDIIGNKFNRLTVKDTVKKYSRTYLVCKCDCGTVKEIKMSHVKSGRTKSCGCLNIEKLKSRKGSVSKLLKPDNYSAKYRLYKKYEKDATNRGYSFNLDIDTFISITKENCIYCGKEPSNIISARQSRSVYIYNGVDRVDNDKGYELDNCEPCCTQCNLAKHTSSKEEFFQWIERVRKHSKIPFSTPSGPTIAFDVDDTLVCWNIPEGYEDDTVEINCDNIISHRTPNRFNIDLLKKMYESGHIVVMWSGSGVKWCMAVAKALNIENYVHGYMSKTTYYIDDKPNPKEWMGKHGFFDLNGNRIHGDNIPDTNK